MATSNSLIDGKELKNKLVSLLSDANDSIVFISAYMTETAIEWLQEHISKDIAVQLVCRLQPSDIINGSTNISVLKTALNNGWSISCLSSLHAKIYMIDNVKIYVGSANFTSNGLNIYGHGNIEACCEVAANSENIAFIQKIISAATIINHDMLSKMQEYIDKQTVSTAIGDWPLEILVDNTNLWVKDMLWCNPITNMTDDEISHDLDILQLKKFSPDDDVFKNRVEHSKPIKWLIARLHEQENTELYFGYISQLLHDELQDDPSPYRKDIKSLVQNLIAYCEICLPHLVEVSRPNHSQRVKLLD